jgi:asparagine synthase (glutamine-hydrolysing)
MFMQYGYVPVPFTIFRGILKLSQGTLLTVQTCGYGDFRLDHVTYWSALDASLRGARDPFPGNEREALMQLKNVLGKAVELQAKADVPVGAFLSGGIDSSIIAAVMQAQSPHWPIRTFSIGFEEQGFDEAPHAAAVAKHLGTEHTELYLTPRETLDVLPHLPALFDEPFADASQIPLFLLAQLTRNHVTVALSGDGGDELFYGYRRFVDAKRFARFAGLLPASGRSLVAAVFESTAAMAGATGMRRPPILRKLGSKFHKAAHLLSANSPRELYWDVLRHWNRGEHVVPGAEPRSSAFISTAPMPRDFDTWMMYQDMVAFLPDDVLTKVDRTTMAVSLEARAPLLDHRVVEFAWTIPMAWKYRKGRGKWLLRQLLYQHVPEHLVDRPKAGFEVPIGNWLIGGLRDWAEDLLAESKMRSEGFFYVARIRRTKLAVLSLGCAHVRGLVRQPEQSRRMRIQKGDIVPISQSHIAHDVLY